MPRRAIETNGVPSPKRTAPLRVGDGCEQAPGVLGNQVSRLRHHCTQVPRIEKGGRGIEGYHYGRRCTALWRSATSTKNDLVGVP